MRLTPGASPLAPSTVRYGALPSAAMTSGEQRAVFAAVLRAARTGADISRSELARRVGVSEAAVRHWENGSSAPRPKTCKRLEVALGLTEGRLGQHLGQHAPTGLPLPEAALQADERLTPGVKAVLLAALAEALRQPEDGQGEDP